MDAMDTTEQEIKQLFQKDRKTIFEPSSQTLAHVLRAIHSQPELKKAKSKTAIWMASATLSLAIVAGLAWTVINQGHAAQLGSHVMVRMDFQNMGKSSDIIKGEIELPNGVEFYSQQFPEIKDQRKLEFDAEGVFAQGQFPFLVRTTEKGVQEIKVKFYNSQNQVVAERSYKINVKGEGVTL